ncbi:MAG: RidA family protein [Hydrogenophaga sp.]|uniref:RidA family protein n=1 Tax=Hydrogenophaga sp. TaxID=1904254 RepID=UPI002726A707|nr:RidA family protein [Hydrogenophaga sp.]MDO9482994.1 RidA family protein [Hydrogenophaga sp.]MDP3345821.1 RidA family protein [Hydrogenophaga sp.]MDP3808278.1 RidA family protein [Hydrogenophaga sp.]
MPRTPRSIDVPGASHNAPIPAAARVGQLLCTSAVSGKDPATGQLPADALTQVGNTFANLRAVLQAGGASLDDVVKFSVTIKDNAVREHLNAVWLACFPDPHDRPARHIVVQDLQHGMWLQIEVMAFVQ